MTRIDLVDVLAPDRLGSDKSQWNPDGLSRSQAEEVVNVVFEAIVEALLKRETVDLPIGTFEVKKRKKPTPSGRLMKVEFTADEWLLPARPGRTGPLPVPRKKKTRKFKSYPREEQLKQMLKAAKKWIVDQGILPVEVISGLLPDAMKWLVLNRGASFPEYPLRPAALLLKTRPANFKQDYGSAGKLKMYPVCAKWFQSWLAHCAPRDPSLREEVVNTLLVWAKAKATLPEATWVGPRWGPYRVRYLKQIPNWRPPR